MLDRFRGIRNNIKHGGQAIGQAPMIQGADHMKDLHEEITAQILAAIEGGSESWEALWDNSLRLGIPYNHSTGKAYAGINILTLWNTAARKGYEVNAWMTYKQAQEQGGQVRKGEKSTLGMFYKPIEDKSQDADSDSDEENGGRRRMMAKAFFLFNVAQIDGLEGLPEPKAPTLLLLTIMTCSFFFSIIRP